MNELINSRHIQLALEELRNNGGQMQYFLLKNRLKLPAARFSVLISELAMLKLVKRLSTEKTRGGKEPIILAKAEDFESNEPRKWRDIPEVNFKRIYGDLLSKLDFSRNSIAGCTKAEGEYHD